MQTEILLPELGTAPGEPVVLSVWFANEGDYVFQGDRLVEVLVAGATFDVSAPADGTLTEIKAFPEDPLQTGQVLGVIQVEETPEEETDTGDPAAPS
jgi:pyruvate/2-oxoglutarate dehydrogenase complex dihydrolipoamide acyltransferase (E2) component